ncbi:phosphoribosylanthranilate isomerase [Edaphobacter sp.]|uniref:phosphoribosylanthranilate isomerase n=1 Tax=Edaphobacter sp. TaxID=1934404 RepID=UPI002DB96559|nr:phosphoribosylanthranilate isomerase [Edaphobacter sp.]HEU5340000.1 phosphoribosylanthranilate isomerase [Edaphobacter sp.]
MWIKICANTNLEDAQLDASLGADAVGFVFAPSKRRVAAEQVARITLHLPASVERVGVFDSHDAEEIVATARTASLNGVQLHGGVDHALAHRLRDVLGGEVAIIQTLHWQVDAGGASAEAVGRHLDEITREGIVNRVLIDSKMGTATGGTGVAFDWEKARATLAEHAGGLKLIVAGGLRPENVAEAIEQLAPWGVDVASGVEAEPGRKDPERLAAFIRNARQAGSGR